MACDLVSVIIPCYNAAAYVESLTSVFAQTYPELELVLVDDCSSDGTWQKLQDFKSAHDDKRIVLSRNDTNLGAGLTRNQGLALSSGKYVCFWEAGDEAEPECLAKMLKKLQQDEADLCYCGYALDAKQYKVDSAVAPELLAAPDMQALQSQVFHFAPEPWNKLVRRDFLKQHEITFSDFADADSAAAWTMQLVLSAKRIAFVDEALYHHNQESDASSEKLDDAAMAALLALLDFQWSNIVEHNLMRSLSMSWQLYFWQKIFFFWDHSTDNIELQKVFALQVRDFCQSHKLDLLGQTLPFGATFPLYRLVPKIKSWQERRRKLQIGYQIYSYMRKFKAIVNIVELVLDKEKKQQQKQQKKQGK